MKIIDMKANTIISILIVSFIAVVSLFDSKQNNPSIIFELIFIALVCLTSTILYDIVYHMIKRNN